MLKRGIFITFEGPEGSGKTTHARLLSEFLRGKNFKVLCTREPGGVKISEKLRSILLDPRNKDIDPTCEMLLYMAARQQIMKQVILPALKSGKIVICDRFLDATMAYQGYAGGVDMDIIRKIGRIATAGVSPDITFLLDIDAGSGLERIGKTKDRVERKSTHYHKKVREGYLDIAKKNPERMKVVPTADDIMVTQRRIRRIVLDFLKL